MQLLVSVRSAAEVEPAIVGGADIIDAKEPARGSLGAVSPETLDEILACVPEDVALSVALGDINRREDVIAAIGSLRLPPRRSLSFVKLGFAGVRSPRAVGRLIGAAVETAARLPSPVRVVAVAYGDGTRADTVAPERIPQLARQAGAAGVLLDTYAKEGLSLPALLGPARLARWVVVARDLDLLSALAGGLGPADLEIVREAGPDVVGVRGAACEGGREGRVVASRVRALSEQMAAPASGYVL